MKLAQCNQAFSILCWKLVIRKFIQVISPFCAVLKCLQCMKNMQNGRVARTLFDFKICQRHICLRHPCDWTAFRLQNTEAWITHLIFWGTFRGFSIIKIFIPLNAKGISTPFTEEWVAFRTFWLEGS